MLPPHSRGNKQFSSTVLCNVTQLYADWSFSIVFDATHSSRVAQKNRVDQGAYEIRICFFLEYSVTGQKRKRNIEMNVTQLRFLSHAKVHRCRVRFLRNIPLQCHREVRGIRTQGSFSIRFSTACRILWQPVIGASRSVQATREVAHLV